MEVSFMSDKAQRRTAAEQYELIMECRSSGMSDHQWCVAHDINRNRRGGGADKFLDLR